MTAVSEKLIKLVDEMSAAAIEANNDFDHLAFVEEAFPCGGDTIGTNLAGNLTYLRDELGKLTIDLRTIGEPR